MDDRETLRVLIDAKNILVRKGWTQRHSARDAAGHAVPWESEDASCFCAGGAVMRVSSGAASDTTPDAALIEISRSIGGDHFAAWNDHPARTKREVLAAFSKAIAAVRGRIEGLRYVVKFADGGYTHATGRNTPYRYESLHCARQDAVLHGARVYRLRPRKGA